MAIWSWQGLAQTPRKYVARKVRAVARRAQHSKRLGQASAETSWIQRKATAGLLYRGRPDGRALFGHARCGCKGYGKARAWLGSDVTSPSSHPLWPPCYSSLRSVFPFCSHPFSRPLPVTTVSVGAATVLLAPMRARSASSRRATLASKSVPTASSRISYRST